MENQQKTIKKYYKLKEKKERTQTKKILAGTEKRTYFDRLYFRIFLSSILLLSLVVVGKYITPNISEILLEHNNVLSIIDKLNIPLLKNDEQSVSNYQMYENITFENGINFVSSDSFSGVNAFESGIVVEIKRINDTYEILVKDSDGIEYYYHGLESIDCYLYQYVSAGDIIGKAEYKKGFYMFSIMILKKNELLDIYAFE